MATKIDTVASRAKLQARREPYWAKVAAGQFIGYRAGDDEGSWIARARTEQGQRYQALGAFDKFAPALRYEMAVETARAWFKHVNEGGSTDDVTVAELCSMRIDEVTQKRGANAGQDVQSRIRRLLESDPIARKVARKLTKRDFEALRQRITGPKSQSTGARDLAAVRAVFSLGLSRGVLTSDAPFREALKGEKVTSRIVRDLVVTPTEVERIIQNAPEDLGKLIRLLALLPIRPGAAANLLVRDWNPQTRELLIRSDKAGAGRKLTAGTALALFIDEQVKGKFGGDFIVPRADGTAWRKDSWKHSVKAAALAAGVGLVDRQVVSLTTTRKSKERQALDLRQQETRFTLYSLRHSGITNMAAAGVPLLVIASLGGTSVQMIQAHYGHIQPHQSAAALDTLAPTTTVSSN